VTRLFRPMRVAKRLLQNLHMTLRNITRRCSGDGGIGIGIGIGDTNDMKPARIASCSWLSTLVQTDVL
jgi:hypothetical protein